jgi:hypothetical protein
LSRKVCCLISSPYIYCEVFVLCRSSILCLLNCAAAAAVDCLLSILVLNLMMSLLLSYFVVLDAKLSLKEVKCCEAYTDTKWPFDPIHTQTLVSSKYSNKHVNMHTSISFRNMSDSNVRLDTAARCGDR